MTTCSVCVIVVGTFFGLAATGRGASRRGSRLAWDGCGAALGAVPARGAVTALSVFEWGSAGTWRVVSALRRCSPARVPASVVRRVSRGARTRGFGRGPGFDLVRLHIEHFAALGFVRGERNVAFHRGEPHQRSEETHGLDAFYEGAIALAETLRHDALQRQDAFARQLDDPALRPLVFRPGLHVPVPRVVERGITGMQVEADLPAFEQRFDLARLLAGQGVVSHVRQGSALASPARDLAHIPGRIRQICA